MCIPCGLVLWFPRLWKNHHQASTSISSLQCSWCCSSIERFSVLPLFHHSKFRIQKTCFQNQTKVQGPEIGSPSCRWLSVMFASSGTVFRKLILLEDLIKLMDLLRNQVNLLEVLIAKEVSVDCIFVITWFYRMVVYADCWGGGTVCIALWMGRSRMRKTWKSLLIHPVVWNEFFKPASSACSVTWF